MEWWYLVWGATHEAILKASSKAQNSFWIKHRSREDMYNFPQVQLIKLSSVSQEYMNGDGRHPKHLSLLKNVFALRRLLYVE